VQSSAGWWRQLPSATPGGEPQWDPHPFDFGLGHQGGAQMYVVDVDGDGKADVVTSLDAHGYGLTWFQQQLSSAGTITFAPHEILPATPTGISFSQLHAVAVADMNGDGCLTSSRASATRPYHDPAEDPVVLYWFEPRGAAGASFVPHLITRARASDGGRRARRDGDGRPDVFTCSKRESFCVQR
jgi:hypothetical protein